MLRVIGRTGVLLLLLLVFSSTLPTVAAPKATINFTEPNGSGDLAPEGADFFSQSFANRITFDNPGDVMEVEGFGSMSQSDGIWRGTSLRTDASMYLLFPGYNLGAQGFNSRTGLRFPVSSSSYSHLVIKYKVSQDTDLVVNWMNASGQPVAMGNSRIYPAKAGVNIIDVDLTATGGGAGGAAWTSQAQWGAIRLDPTKFKANVTVELDWVRLVPATSGATFHATWTCASCSSGFTMFADSDNNSANGGTIDLGNVDFASDHAFDVPVGKLAPGSYYLGSRNGSDISYSPGKFTVQGAPLVTINSPSSTSGEDFATTVLGKPWNMRSAASIAGSLNITDLTFADGAVQGTPTNNAPSIILLDSPVNGPTINTAIYKYLTFDLSLTRPGSSVSNSALVNWFTAAGGVGGSGSITNWYDGWQHYSLDLSHPTTPAANAVPWDGTQSLSKLEIRPSGDPIPPSFKLGPVRLTADPEVAQGGKLAVSWVSTSSTGNVALFFDQNRNYSGTSIAASVPLADGAYIWSVPDSVAPGKYWLRLQANDGLNSVTRWYSNVQFVVKARQTGFSDVSSSNNFYPFIQNLLNKGIIDGYTNGTFQPYADASRVMVARWVVKARGWAPDLTGAPHFTDVPPSHPDYVYVETAFNHNVLSGYEDHTFRPDTGVTRGQMSKMIVIGFGWALDTSGGPHFNDVTASNTFYDQIETIFNHGLVSGYDSPGGGYDFRWGNSLTRSQLAKVLSNAVGP